MAKQTQFVHWYQGKHRVNMNNDSPRIVIGLKSGNTISINASACEKLTAMNPARTFVVGFIANPKQIVFAAVDKFDTHAQFMRFRKDKASSGGRINNSDLVMHLECGLEVKHRTEFEYDPASTTKTEMYFREVL